MSSRDSCGLGLRVQGRYGNYLKRSSSFIVSSLGLKGFPCKYFSTLGPKYTPYSYMDPLGPNEGP